MKYNISKKKRNKYYNGGAKTKEEIIRMTDPIVMELFSREKNIFYFLEFVKNQLTSEKEEVVNSAIGINDRLSVFTLMIETIKTRTLEIDNEDDSMEVTAVQNGGSKKNKKKIKGGAWFPNLLEYYLRLRDPGVEEYGIEEVDDKIKEVDDKINRYFDGQISIDQVFPEELHYTKVAEVENVYASSYEGNWEENFAKHRLKATEDLLYFIVELTKKYTTRKIELIERNPPSSYYQSVLNFSKFIFSKLKELTESNKLNILEVIPIETLQIEDTTIPEELRNVITQEDIDNFNSFKSIELNLAELTKKFKSLLTEKIKTINDVSILTILSNIFYTRYRKDIKEYVKENEREYRVFMDTIMLNTKSGEGAGIDTVLQIRNMTKIIKDNLINLLLNKELSTTLINSLGFALDSSSLFTILPFLCTLSAGGVMDYFKTPGLTAVGVATTQLVGQMNISNFKGSIDSIASYSGRKLTSDFFTHNDELLNNIGSNIVGSMLLSLNAESNYINKKMKNLANATADFLYRNNEFTATLLDKYENNEQLIKLTDDILNMVDDITFGIINTGYRNDELWDLISQKKQMYINNSKIQETINSEYVDIFFNYRKLVVDINNAICRVRCVETFMPDNILESVIEQENDSYISYYDLDTREYVTMYYYVSKKYPIIADTIGLLTNLIKKIEQAYAIKYDICDYIKNEIKKILDKIVIRKSKSQNEKTGRWGPLGHRNILGGAVNLYPDDKKEEILEILCTIITCEWKLKYGVDVESEVTRKTNELLQNNSTEKLHNLTGERQISSISGMQLLNFIQNNYYQDLLKDINEEYVSNLSSESDREQTTSTKFLDTLFNSVNDLRIKFSFELFNAYLNSDEYIKFKQSNENIFREMFLDIERKSKPIVQYLTLCKITATTIGIKGIMSFINSWHDYKTKISEFVNPIKGTMNAIAEYTNEAYTNAKKNGGGTKKNKKYKNKKYNNKTKRH